MSTKNKSRIKELTKEITLASDAYYNSDKPIMSDLAFDALVNELKELDPANKLLAMVGAPLRPSEWKKAKHQIPMGSLDKVNSPEELIDWAKDKKCDEWFLCEKLDGISINVVFDQGKMVQAITRGSNGIEGEDITINVIKMNDGKLAQLKNSNFTGSIRGEIVMLKSVHKEHFADKANPRNAAAGISKRLDGIGAEKLTVMFYQVLGDIEFKTENEQFQWLLKQGQLVPNHWVFKTIDKVNEHWRKYQDEKREKLDYDLDGLVCRINNLVYQQSFGSRDMRPKAAKAFKFDNEAKETILLDVIWEPGNSGRITPVAIVSPVIISGVEVKRASLHNVKRVKELDLEIGCKVLVSRRNDVIPYVEEKII